MEIEINALLGAARAAFERVSGHALLWLMVGVAVIWFARIFVDWIAMRINERQ
jgi:hypothetical protein